MQMLAQRRDEPCSCFSLCFGCIASDPEPTLHKGSDKPGPNRSQMVRIVTLRHSAFVVWNVSRFLRRKGSQSNRCQQIGFDGFKKPARSFTIDQLVGKTTHG